MILAWPRQLLDAFMKPHELFSGLLVISYPRLMIRVLHDKMGVPVRCDMSRCPVITYCHQYETIFWINCHQYETIFSINPCKVYMIFFFFFFFGGGVILQEEIASGYALSYTIVMWRGKQYALEAMTNICNLLTRHKMVVEFVQWQIKWVIRYEKVGDVFIYIMFCYTFPNSTNWGVHTLWDLMST